MNASFFDNKALNEPGGVIHLDIGSNVIFNVNACSETVFKGNTALGVSNSIHMLDLTNVTFSIEQGSKVQMYDALSDEISNSDSSAATLEVKGLGEFNLRKTSIIKGTNLKLDGLFKLKKGANLTGKSIENNSVLKIVANSRRFDKRTYKMLEYTSNCEGKFKYVEMDESFGRVKSVDYGHNGIFVTLEWK
ncbi:MAG: hypothetical protein LBB44_01980 [Endomicrobium sp.]|jgi:hypothetical protein|nr:hypothetical protein [Endomicrobium sp.]